MCRSQLASIPEPQLRVGVVTSSNALVEAWQTIESPALYTADSIWWGYTWRMATPLENVGEDVYLVVAFANGSLANTAQASGIAAVSRFKIDKEQIDTGAIKLLFEPSATVEMQPPPSAPGGRKGNSGAFPVIVSSNAILLDAEIEIVKNFRHTDLLTITRST